MNGNPKKYRTIGRERETLDIPELAKILGISRGTCYQLAAKNKLPVKTFRIGHRLVVSCRQVDDLLNRKATGAQGEE
jgi:excisionase family DNA binding protein